MKILIINQHPHDYIGGSEIQCDLIAHYLHKLGHHVFYGIANPLRNNYECDYNCIPIKKPFIISYAALVKQSRPDIIYWRFNKKHLFFGAVLIAKKFKIRFVFAITSFCDTERWIWSGTKPLSYKANPKEKCWKIKPLLKWIRSLALPIKSAWNYNGFYLVDACVTLRTDLVEKLPIKREICIYDSMRSEYRSFEWKRPYVLWVANLKSQKNPEKFVELAEHFEESGVDFLMVGKIQDNHYAYLQSSENLPRNLYYLGPKSLEEVNGMLKSSLFLVHTCDPEGFGNNFIQAWLQAKPTISLYFDPESIIIDNQLGFVSGSVEQMVKDVKKLIEDQKLRIEIGQRAKNFAQQHFDPELNVRKLEEFLIQTLA